MILIKRIMNFKEEDWKHVGFLFLNMLKQFFNGDIQESKEAFYFMRLHFTNDSQLVD